MSREDPLLCSLSSTLNPVRLSNRDSKQDSKNEAALGAHKIFEIIEQVRADK